MPSAMRSVLETQDLSINQVRSLFESSRKLRQVFRQNSRQKVASSENEKVVVLAFFEPSTRTRMSFEIAALRLGYQTVRLDSSTTSSLAKGETFVDTIKNIEAMSPDLLVVRSADGEGFWQVLRSLSLPVINGGLGTHSHPTQALLDAFTIEENLGNIEGQKVLFVGDVAHSRVAKSNLDLLTRMGAQIGFCAPKEWWPKEEDWKKTKCFESLEAGLKWSSVCIGLRVQFERHTESQLFNSEHYHKSFGLNKQTLSHLSPQAIIMHPGPILFGCEFDRSVMEDSRTKVYEQVSNGVLIRSALLKQLLHGEEEWH